MSPSMPQKTGRTRLRFWAKSAAGEAPLYSRVPPAMLAENDISLASVATPRWRSSEVNSG